MPDIVQPNDKRVVEELIDDSWEVSRAGREDVPKPQIVVEGDAERRSVYLNDNDVIFVTDGGSPIIEPASVGHMSEYIESMVDLVIHTSHSEERFDGHPEDGQYGGLVGEVKRIADKYRLGFGGYDRMQTETFEDETGQYGADRWTGIWNLRLYSYAQNIGQEAERR